MILRAILLSVSVVASVCLPVSGPAEARRAPPPSGDASRFKVQVREDLIPYDVMGIYVLPGERVAFEALAAGGPGQYRFNAPAGTTEVLAATRWAWTAPSQPGLYYLTISAPAMTNVVTINAFVMVPASELAGGELRGYRIGQYPTSSPKNNPMYARPVGFVEVTRADENTRVSPHFKLRQFVSKQTDGYPKFVVLQERLLLKLEAIVTALQAHGYSSIEGVHVMSGYRTPFYNKAIGNVAHSMHQWGAAADIFVDRDGDGVMDDLNGDRRSDRLDAVLLSNLVDSVAADGELNLRGGLGLYNATPAHGPFVHVDVRGYAAHWSD